ncbi:MAG: ParB/RepB/Spo0J family partition protein [Caedimonas sp.]|nr:ParB/RepB/Spo0J family partition protein [Caedimonas sp.]
MSQSSTTSKSLGRGLEALLGSDPLIGTGEENQSIRIVSIHELAPGRYQPRESFDQESLDSLIASVREKGVIQPILVRPVHHGLANYEIVAGERRWRAAKEAGFAEIPAIVREMSDLEALETGLIENIQRHDLNPLEEAQGFKRLMDEFQYTQDDLAQALGKSRSYIANSVRLLSLGEEVKEALKKGKITAGHARALINSEFPQELLQKIIRNGLNVRQTEKLVQRGQKVSKIERINFLPENDNDIKGLIQRLTEKLHLKVNLDLKPNGSGVLNIHFHSLEQLDILLTNLSLAV